MVVPAIVVAESGREDMVKNFHEQFEQETPPLPSDRSTGLVFAVVAAIVAWIWRADITIAGTALAIAGAFALVSLVLPIVLRPLNIAWMKLALLMNMVISPVVMLVLFLVAIVPAGLLMQLRYDPLRRRRPAGESYWITRAKDAAPTSMSNQF